MILSQVLKDRRVLSAFIIICVIILIPFSAAFAASDKKPKPMPLTIDNPDIFYSYIGCLPDGQAWVSYSLLIFYSDDIMAVLFDNK